MNDLTAWPVHILAQNGDGMGGLFSYLPLLAIPILAYFMMIRPEQKKAAEAKKMLDGIKKNDRVETIGGIIATVVSVKKDQQEVVLRLDDKSGTEMRVRMRAIAGVLSREGKASDNAES
ncbi:preprotein translocase subunit YajC [Blastopirellula marina]|uniref:Sec translocon accessory complex subunit YajC n=1 Tax=Blastopirellula marina TaxID=124 RepID=A0A2S8G948_9BACT|nr:preprotein translocase subunit YajC [Blastopirellula marina]PQO40992.1 preprotein translocase subunit YajC [Blastopirellula marina]PTL45875.1 preprotein translocase subunit YajC [Blastopirellula marina]